jgi:hypothetical protein
MHALIGHCFLCSAQPSGWHHLAGDPERRVGEHLSGGTVTRPPSRPSRLLLQRRGERLPFRLGQVGDVEVLARVKRRDASQETEVEVGGVPVVLEVAETQCSNLVNTQVLRLLAAM